MRIFISYRRDDTAGRAGRLFDVLVNRFGSRDVFQDVAAIAPGADFTQKVSDAISRSDVALAVIGLEWLTIQGPDGTRRLDEPGDYVRGEVSAALAAGVPVVPVLVGGAELPAADDLPADLRPLVNRQAARIRDDSWHQDVDALVRRLEGEEVVDTPPRRWPLVATAAALAVAAVVIGWVWIGRDGDGGAESSDDGPPACSRPDSSWNPIDVTGAATEQGSSGTQSFSARVESVDYQVQDGDNTVLVLQVTLQNHGTQDEYFYWAMIRDLLVDTFSIGDPTCFSMLSADQNVEPGEGARALVGWDGEFDPAGVPLVLEVSGGDVAFDIEITEGG